MDDYLINITKFNQELMELNIKYNEEIERLNNIINELEKFIVKQIEEQETLKETKSPSFIFCKLQELKEKYETKY